MVVRIAGERMYLWRAVDHEARSSTCWCSAAATAGRPVIATDVAGNSEVVEDGVTGFLADAPTVSGFSEALERFWAGREDAQMIGGAGSQKIRQLVPPDPVRIFSE